MTEPRELWNTTSGVPHGGDGAVCPRRTHCDGGGLLIMAARNAVSRRGAHVGGPMIVRVFYGGQRVTLNFAELPCRTVTVGGLQHLVDESGGLPPGQPDDFPAGTVVAFLDGDGYEVDSQPRSLPIYGCHVCGEEWLRRHSPGPLPVQRSIRQPSPRRRRPYVGVPGAAAVEFSC